MHVFVGAAGMAEIAEGLNDRKELGEGRRGARKREKES